MKDAVIKTEKAISKIDERQCAIQELYKSLVEQQETLYFIKGKKYMSLSDVEGMTSLVSYLMAFFQPL